MLMQLLSCFWLNAPEKILEKVHVHVLETDDVIISFGGEVPI